MSTAQKSPPATPVATWQPCSACGGTGADQTIPDIKGRSWNVRIDSGTVCTICADPQHPAHGLPLKKR